MTILLIHRKTTAMCLPGALYLTVTVLNLGNLARMPRLANRKLFPREIREDVPEELGKRLVLPYSIVNNPGLLSPYAKVGIFQFIVNFVLSTMLSEFNVDLTRNFVLLQFPFLSNHNLVLLKSCITGMNRKTRTHHPCSTGSLHLWTEDT